MKSKADLFFENLKGKKEDKRDFNVLFNQVLNNIEQEVLKGIIEEENKKNKPKTKAKKKKE